MKIKVSKFNASKTRYDLFDEPHWDNDEITLHAWRETKERYSVPFDKAKFCLDLLTAAGVLQDTFYMTEKDYSKLTNVKNKVKHNA